MGGGGGGRGGGNSGYVSVRERPALASGRLWFHILTLISPFFYHHKMILQIHTNTGINNKHSDLFNSSCTCTL